MRGHAQKSNGSQSRIWCIFVSFFICTALIINYRLTFKPEPIHVMQDEIQSNMKIQCPKNTNNYLEGVRVDLPREMSRVLSLGMKRLQDRTAQPSKRKYFLSHSKSQSEVYIY